MLYYVRLCALPLMVSYRGVFRMRAGCHGDNAVWTPCISLHLWSSNLCSLSPCFAASKFNFNLQWQWHWHGINWSGRDCNAREHIPTASACCQKTITSCKKLVHSRLYLIVILHDYCHETTLSLLRTSGDL